MSLALGVAMGVSFASNFLNGVKKSNEAYQEALYYANQESIYKNNAEKIRLTGAINEDVMRAKNRNYLAKANAVASEAGMAESVTMANAIAYNDAILEQDVLNARYETENQAENYLYQAKVARINANEMKKKSNNWFQSGLLNGISSAFNVYSSKA